MNASLPPSPLSDSQRQQVEALTRELNDQQLDWVQGYLAGYRAAREGGGEQPVRDQGGPPLTVLFGSQTGNAETLAEQLTEKARAKGLEVECLDMDAFPNRRLKKERQVAIITSTHGEGDPPDNAMGLYEYLHGRKAPKVGQLRYAVLALGDTSYEHFCQTGVDFDQRLAELGAERLLERVDCDVDYEEAAEQWVDRLLGKLSETAPTDRSSAAPAEAPASQPAPQKARFDRKNPYAASLLDRVSLTGRGSSKAVHHLELSLEESGLDYTPGDSLGVYVQNDPALVERILDKTGLDGSQSVTLKDEKVDLGRALQHHIELTRVTPPTVQRWAKLSGSSELTELARHRRELIGWLHGRDLLDLLEAYPVEGLDAQTLVDQLRRLPPRLYSIASSQAAVEDEVHLTVAAVRYEQRGRQREGVGSTWLADRLALDETAPVFVDNNKNFRLPDDGQKPIIMIGPGTGIAPFRAFMQERETLEQPGKNWLFFGDRNFRTDFLYQREWLQWRKQGLLNRLDLAFSRDEPDKIYVQHRIREAGAELWRWIDEGAHVYVCGDANAMAPDVHEALIDVISSHGHQSRDNAQQYLREMTREKRYQRDVY